MDPNLSRIKEANMHTIMRGKVHQAISDAEDYLSYVTGFNFEQKQSELDTFIKDIKEIRRKSRGQNRKQRQ